MVTRALDFEVTAVEPVRRTKPFGHDGGKLGLQRRLAELLGRVTPPQSWLRHLARPDRWATLPNRDGVAYSFLRVTESAFSLHGRVDYGSHLPEREIRRIRDPDNVWRTSWIRRGRDWECVERNMHLAGLGNLSPKLGERAEVLISFFEVKHPKGPEAPTVRGGSEAPGKPVRLVPSAGREKDE